MPNNLSNADGFTLKFGVEELALLVQNLGGDTLRGLGDAPFGSLNEREKALLTQCASHSLLARGYLVPLGDDGRLGVDDAVRKIILLALQPLHIVTMIRRVLDSHSENYYYLAPEHLAIHHHASMGIHSLDVTFSWPNFVDDLSAQLNNLLPSATGGKAFLLSVSKLQTAKELALQGQLDKALATLIQEGAPRAQALPLVYALIQPELEWFIHVQSRQSGLKPYEKALTILCHEQTCWGIQGENDGGKSGMALIQPLNQTNYLALLQTLFLLV